MTSAAAKKLLADAGYPNGFEVDDGLPERPLRQRRGDLPGRDADALAHRHQGEAQRPCRRPNTSRRRAPTRKYDSSFNLLGWTPGSFDSWNVLENIIGCRDENGKGGTFNYRRLLQSQDEELNKQILVETDTAKRDELIAEAFRSTTRRRANPAAPAVAGLGRVEEGRDRAARRQPDPVLLGEDEIGSRCTLRGGGLRGACPSPRQVVCQGSIRHRCSHSPSAGSSRRSSSC